MSVLPISSFPNTVDSEIDWKIIVLKKSYHLKCVVEKRVLDQTRNKHAQFWVRKKTLLLMVQKCRLSPMGMDYIHLPKFLWNKISLLSQKWKKFYKEIPRDFLFTIFPPTKGKRANFSRSTCNVRWTTRLRPTAKGLKPSRLEVGRDVWNGATLLPLNPCLDDFKSWTSEHPWK